MPKYSWGLKWLLSSFDVKSLVFRRFQVSGFVRFCLLVSLLLDLKLLNSLFWKNEVTGRTCNFSYRFQCCMCPVPAVSIQGRWVKVRKMSAWFLYITQFHTVLSRKNRLKLTLLSFEIFHIIVAPTLEKKLISYYQDPLPKLRVPNAKGVSG